MGKIQNPEPYTVIIFLRHSTRSIVAIVALTIYGSMIPEHLAEIRNIVRDFLNCKGCNKLISKENLFYLHRIENQDVVHISACGLLFISRRFLLSIIGLMLTYGLLIINLEI